MIPVCEFIGRLKYLDYLEAYYNDGIDAHIDQIFRYESDEDIANCRKWIKIYETKLLEVKEEKKKLQKQLKL